MSDEPTIQAEAQQTPAEVVVAAPVTVPETPRKQVSRAPRAGDKLAERRAAIKKHKRMSHRRKIHASNRPG